MRRFTNAFNGFIALLAIIFMSFNIGFAAWEVSNPKIEATTVIKTTTSRVICYNKETGVKYLSLKTALDNAEQNQNIYVYPGSDITIAESIKIKENVSLIVPYKDELWDITSNDEIKTSTFCDTSAANVSTYRTSRIKMIDGADIDIQGTLCLGAIFGVRGVNGLYTEITLCEGSSISCSGTFYCYGYVKEEAYNDGQTKINSGINSDQFPKNNYENNECDQDRFINVEANGIVYSPIAIHDLPSTGNISTYKGNGVCPMTIVEFPNLQTFTKFQYGSQFISKLRVVLGSGSNLYYTNENAPIINKDTDSNPAMFKLSDGYIAFEYCPQNTSYTTYSTAIDVSPTRIYLFGTTSLCGLKFTINLTFSVTVDTREMYLPISNKLQIFICKKGVFNVDYKVKFLPSSSITIEDGGTYNNKGSTFVYTSSKFSEIKTSTYPTTLRNRDASFVNNGSLKLSEGSYFGGFISTKRSDGNAIVDLTGTKSENLKASLPEGLEGDLLSEQMSSMFFDEDAKTSVKGFFVEGTKVNSYKNTGNLNCWAGECLIIVKLKISVENLYQYNYALYRVYRADDANGTNQSELTSSEFSSSSDFDMPKGKYFKITLSGKEQSAAFTLLPSSSEYTFISNTWFLIRGETELDIVPAEGKKIVIATESESGAGSTTYKITDTDTKSELASFTSGGELIVVKGTKFKITFSGGYNSNLKQVAIDYIIQTNLDTNVDQEITDYSSTFVADQSWKFFTYIKEGGCLLPTAKVLMADGTYKQARDIKTGDMVISFNHEAGMFEPNRVIGNDDISKQAETYNVVHLEFSNGKSTDFIYEHGYFDKTLNKYVYLHEDDFADYMGHEFVFYENGVVAVAKLVAGSISEVFTALAAPATANHLNLVVDDMLSIEGGLSGLFNIFEYDPDTLTFDKEKMDADIQKYGLLGYESFEKYFPKEIYELLPCKYLGVSIGKGLITWDIFEGYVDQWKDQLLENL